MSSADLVLEASKTIFFLVQCKNQKEYVILGTMVSKNKNY